MNALQLSLARQIEQTGPISLAEYMATCLLDPTHGYYTTRTPFGARGDFTTAPEISQMFGELLGLCLAQAWLDQGAPDPFVLAELGPGRGTLMDDLMRATAAVPGFHSAARLTLVEASPALQQIQAGRLANWDVAWAGSVDDLPEGPLFLIANEFFDALPIRQYQRSGPGWRECLVGVTPDAGLTLAPGPPCAPPQLVARLGDTAEGDIVELCPAAGAIIWDLARRMVKARRGAALIFDYGGWRSLGDTFQALVDHAPADPFAEPGRADLTAHVDFAALAAAATGAGATVSAMTGQGVLLERLGITARARALAAKLSGRALEQHIAAHKRLTHPMEMGTLFKTIAMTAPGAPIPAGYDAE